jgi:hypothetical protein
MILTGSRHSIDIHLPIDLVFDALASFTTDQHWRSGVIEMRHPGPEQTGLGSQRIEVRKIGSRVVETPDVMIIFEKPHAFAVQRASGPIRPIAEYRFYSTSDGTRFTLAVDVPLSGLSVLTYPVVAVLSRLIARSIPSDLIRLGQFLETKYHDRMVPARMRS